MFSYGILAKDQNAKEVSEYSFEDWIPAQDKVLYCELVWLDLSHLTLASKE